MTGAIRILALIAAVSGGIGIAIQLGVQVDKEGSLGAGLWQLARYYTYWTNSAVFVLMLATLLAPGARIPRLFLVATSSIVLVGVIYYTLIYGRSAEFPLPQQIAEHLLHGVVPVATLTLFLIRPHGALRFRDIGYGVIPVIVYGAYLLVRGAVDGTYPYWFTDVPKLGIIGSIKSGVMLIGAFAFASAVFVLLDKALALVLPHRRASP